NPVSVVIKSGELGRRYGELQRLKALVISKTKGWIGGLCSSRCREHCRSKVHSNTRANVIYIDESTVSYQVRFDERCRQSEVKGC
ncbi:6556_t:CDS:1, partial [Acaulospora colombiana]